MKICQVEGCGKKHQAKGLCDMHYRRSIRNAPPRLSLEERFWEKVDVSGPEECWAWTAMKDHEGYGRFYGRRRKVMAHRMAYELRVGEIPEGMVIDHQCGNRGCVNPSHLRIATPAANAQYQTVVLASNQSGVRGVYWSAKDRKWIATLRVGPDRREVGRFDLFADAEATAMAARADSYVFPAFEEGLR